MRQQYPTPTHLPSVSRMSSCICGRPDVACSVEYTPQAYVATDMDMFFEEFSPTQVGERPIMVSIDGGECLLCIRSFVYLTLCCGPPWDTGFVQTNQTGFDYNGESNLDLQYSMTLVGGAQPVTLYQAGDDVEGGCGCMSISSQPVLTRE